MSFWKGKVGPILIAEIGGNHEGDFEYAVELTRLAIEADVDYIKFQIYTGDTLVNKLESPTRNEHFKKFELTREQHLTLAQMCHERNIGYLASIWNTADLDWIDQHMNFYKIGSGDLTAYPVLKAIASKNKPIVLSTGLAEKSEVIDTIEYLQSINPMYADKNNLALLQCTAMYPIPNSDANLLVIQDLKQATGLTVGYSDHTVGSQALEAAVTLGAEILEFHFTDTRENKSFRDHQVSLTKDEVILLKEKILLIQDLLGSPQKQSLKIEAQHLVSFRRAIFLNRDLGKNEIIKETDLTFLRPNHGIDAREVKRLIGKRAKTKIKKLQKLDWSLFT
ncbi:MAG: N-acetylneuraminate synthase family protein [Cyclobacteriaceae bacterium]